MKMTGVDWRPFKAEFPVLFGDGGYISIWVGEGWFQILWDLCVSLERIAQSRVADAKPPVRIVQVKEKYGTLRVYVDGGSQAIHDLIDAAELASERICEACGKPGNLLCLRGWYQTLCLYHELESRISSRSSFGITVEDPDPESASWNVLLPMNPSEPRSTKLYLEDIAKAIADISAYTGDLDRHAFEGNEVLRDAVLYLVGVIGTASRQIPENLIGPTPSTTWCIARGLRDHTAVECFGLNDMDLWSAITETFPMLAVEVGQLLRPMQG